VGQDAFSIAVRQNYEHRCCFPGCEVDHDALLVAAHITRWADNSAARGEISNGLCLCGLHDKAFEAGFFTIADDLTVTVDLQRAPESIWITSLLQQANGQQIKLGKIRPSLEAIREHRNRHTECPQQNG
jgi:predicted restriction endonuclease